MTPSQPATPDRRPEFKGIARLYREHADEFVAFALRLTHDTDRAWDVFHTVVRRVLEHPGRVPDGLAAVPWVKRAIINEVRHRHARDKAAKAAREVLQREPPRPPPLTPAEDLRRYEMRAATGELLAFLTPEQRELVDVVLMRGLSYAEAASQLGEPIRTLETRMRRAREALRRNPSARALWRSL